MHIHMGIMRQWIETTAALSDGWGKSEDHRDGVFDLLLNVYSKKLNSNGVQVPLDRPCLITLFLIGSFFVNLLICLIRVA